MQLRSWFLVVDYIFLLLLSMFLAVLKADRKKQQKKKKKELKSGSVFVSFIIVV